MHPYGTRAECTHEVMPYGWYAVYTRHQHEKSAAQVLANKGFSVLLPLYQTSNRWKDRVQVVHLPLFPSYLFVQTDLDRRIEILRTPGVCWLVGTSGVPTPLPVHEIETVRRLAESPARLQPHPYLNRGDRVRVIAGPLSGMEGILQRTKNQSRVVITIELLQKSASVEVDLSVLERISITRPPSVVPLLDLNCCS